MAKSLITKALEGKQVYLRPTGNLARRNHDKIYSAKVDKVAKVFITITLKGCQYSDKLRFNGNTRHLTTDHNSGYWLFETKQELTDKIRVEKIASAIVDKFQYQHHFCKLELSTIEQIAKLLNIDI